MITPGTETGLTRAALIDMLENPLKDFYEAAKGVTLSFRGFEMKTILFITD